MTNHSHRTLARLAPLATAAALLATACGSSTTTSQADAPLSDASVDADQAALDVETAPTTPEPTTTIAAPPTTVAETPDATDTPAAPTTTPPAICGDSGPLPPLPDSMPTLLFDTDGDGDADDEVTAYGDIDGWLLRVVENGVVSEALMTGIPGHASIANTYQVDGRDYIEVHDQELGTIFTHATVKGCVELLHVGPGHEAIDDLATPPPVGDPMPPTGPSDLAAAPNPCGNFNPIPGAALIQSNLTLDVTDDGTADDQVYSYLDGDGWTIRATVDGTTSEVDIAGVGPGAVRVLGTAPVGDLSAGNEIIATVGAGASTTLVGVFGIDANGCLFHFLDSSGDELAMPAGASVAHGARFTCGDGYIAQESWGLEGNGMTYFVDGAAFVESVPGEFSYMLNSDGYDEGVTIDELPSDLFDCNGLSL